MTLTPPGLKRDCFRDFSLSFGSPSGIVFEISCRTSSKNPPFLEEEGLGGILIQAIEGVPEEVPRRSSFRKGFLDKSQNSLSNSGRNLRRNSWSNLACNFWRRWNLACLFFWISMLSQQNGFNMKKPCILMKSLQVMHGYKPFKRNNYLFLFSGNSDFVFFVYVLVQPMPLGSSYSKNRRFKHRLILFFLLS